MSRKDDILSFRIILHNANATIYSLSANGKLVSDKLKPDAKGILTITDFNVKGLSGKVPMLLTAANGTESPCAAVSREGFIDLPAEVQFSEKCADVVKEDIEKADKTLNEALKGVANTLLLSQGKSLAGVFDIAKKNMPTIDTTATQTKILGPLSDRLPAIMSIKLERAEERAVVSTMLQSALILMIDTIRCADKPDAKVKDLVLKLLQLFQKNGPNIAPFFPGLDKGGSLTAFINAYGTAMVSQDKDILTTLKEILKLLKGSFPQ